VPDSSRALSFGTVATAYHRYRPRTPAELLHWLLPQSAVDVVDLAAGTGALTELLVARVPAVTAVEPDPGMREVLQSAAPSARLLAGTAENIPLDDASADALFVSSAWHWFDHERAVPEIARVLRDGGRLAVLGNGADREVAWMKELRDQRFFSSEAQRRRHSQVALPDGAPFGPSERQEIRWTMPMAVDDLLNLLETFSRVITAAPADRQQMRQRARAVLAEHPETRGRETIEVPMRSWGWRADRLPRDR
jgi:SAM-dependent methyltransferase